MSTEQMPTIASKAKWSIVFAGGRSLGGHRVEPGDLGVGAEADQERVEAGDPDPSLDAVGRAAAAEVLGHVPWVCCTHSMAANLTGWSSAIARAAVSPTANWIGVAIAATVSGINSPRRWWRSRRPRSIPTA